MATDEPMEIPGETIKPFRVYRMGLNCLKAELLASYDTEAEARAHPKKRLDIKTAIFHEGKKLP